MRPFAGPWRLTFFDTRCFAALLKAAEFKHIFDKVGVTHQVYAGNPLAAMSFPRRGFLLQEWGRHVLASKNPNMKVAPAALGRCINGTKRSTHNAKYDMLLGDKRVELKSAQLAWCQTYDSWQATWRSIKFPFLYHRRTAAFDDLYLTLFTPNGLHFLKHDLKTAISSDGIRTAEIGHRIRVVAGKQATSCEAATAAVLHKLCSQGGCVQVGYGQVSDSIVQELLSSHQIFGDEVYHRTPLAFLNGTARGLLIQELMFEIDKSLNGASIFTLPKDQPTYRGMEYSRGSANTTVDWIRDGLRVEAKHARLCFNTNAKRWQCVFYAIKAELFDELWLALYSPEGIDIYLHNPSLHLTSTGVTNECLGRSIRLCGPAHELDPGRALETMRSKLSHCRHIATVAWDWRNPFDKDFYLVLLKCPRRGWKHWLGSSFQMLWLAKLAEVGRIFGWMQGWGLKFHDDLSCTFCRRAPVAGWFYLTCCHVECFWQSLHNGDQRTCLSSTVHAWNLKVAPKDELPSS